MLLDLLWVSSDDWAPVVGVCEVPYLTPCVGTSHRATFAMIYDPRPDSLTRGNTDISVALPDLQGSNYKTIQIQRSKEQHWSSYKFTFFKIAY